MMRKTSGDASKPAFDPKAFLAKIGVGVSARNYPRNQPIFAQGDVADAVFYIHTGRVKATVHSDHGKEAIVGIFSARPVFW